MPFLDIQNLSLLRPLSRLRCQRHPGERGPTRTASRQDEPKYAGSLKHCLQSIDLFGVGLRVGSRCDGAVLIRGTTKASRCFDDETVRTLPRKPLGPKPKHCTMHPKLSTQQSAVLPEYRVRTGNYSHN